MEFECGEKRREKRSDASSAIGRDRLRREGEEDRDAGSGSCIVDEGERANEGGGCVEEGLRSGRRGGRGRREEGRKKSARGVDQASVEEEDGREDVRERRRDELPDCLCSESDCS